MNSHKFGPEMCYQFSAFTFRHHEINSSAEPHPGDVHVMLSCREFIDTIGADETRYKDKGSATTYCSKGICIYMQLEPPPSTG